MLFIGKTFFHSSIDWMYFQESYALIGHCDGLNENDLHRHHIWILVHRLWKLFWEDYKHWPGRLAMPLGKAVDTSKVVMCTYLSLSPTALLLLFQHGVSATASGQYLTTCCHSSLYDHFRVWPSRSRRPNKYFLSYLGHCVVLRTM